MKFGLTNSAFNMILNVFKEHPEIKTVRVFGSRATDNYKPNSDIDLVLWGNVDLKQQGKISLELNELPLPYNFEVTVYERITHIPLKQNIDQYAQVFYTQEETAEEGN